MYDNPNHLFVSTFLGNPPINVLQGKAKSKGHFVLEDGTSIKLNNQYDYQDKDVYLAVRPEAIAVADETRKF